MKRVIFRNLEDNKQVLVSNFNSLLENYLYIGFKPQSSSHRYMVLRKRLFKGVAVRPGAYWNSEKDPENPSVDEGEYFVFNTEKELLLWMAQSQSKE